jgi:hypothetical protein
MTWRVICLPGPTLFQGSSVVGPWPWPERSGVGASLPVGAEASPPSPATAASPRVLRLDAPGGWGGVPARAMAWRVRVAVCRRAAVAGAAVTLSVIACCATTAIINFASAPAYRPIAWFSRLVAPGAGAMSKATTLPRGCRDEYVARTSLCGGVAQTSRVS